jgi:hypothetical protein
MQSIFKILKSDLHRNPQLVSALSNMAEESHEYTDHFFFIVPNSKVYSFIGQLKTISSSYEAWLTPSMSTTPQATVMEQSEKSLFD